MSARCWSWKHFTPEDSSEIRPATFQAGSRHLGAEYKTTSPSHPRVLGCPRVISPLCSLERRADPSQISHPIKSKSLLSSLLARNPTAVSTLTRSPAWERLVQLLRRLPGPHRGRWLCRNRRGWHPLQEKEILYRQRSTQRLLNTALQIHKHFSRP